MRSTYKGRYKVKKPEKYEGDISTVTYRSSWEKFCFLWAERNSSVIKWSSEEVVIPYLYEADRKWHRYFMDLKLVMEDGRTILVEIKPKSQTIPPKVPQRKTKKYLNESFTFIKNQNKWDAAREYCADRGWSFEIWTEDVLSSMGMKMTKSTSKKKITPLKPLPRKKKK